MRILVCNDDGYDTSGIRELASALREIAEVHVCAPLQNCSGASSSQTYPVPPWTTVKEGLTIVRGTPVDCVNIALLSKLCLPWKPDLTVSGINYGGNLGDDTIYSGTVAAAAMSIRRYVPAMAFSLACVPEGNFPPIHFHEAAAIARDLVAKLAEHVISVPGMMLNINIPDLPAGKVKEAKACVLGKRHPKRPAKEVGRKNDLGIRRYEIGFNASTNAGKGDTDFEAIESGHVSVTPLNFDTTEHRRLGEISGWVDSFVAQEG